MTDELSLAAEQGRICALAAQGQRDLQRRVQQHPDLFSVRPFDPALYSSIALAIAFSAPWCTPEELRITNRSVLWGFAVDWQIDYLASCRADVDRVVANCLAVADGAVPDADDPLGRFLAEVRDDLAEVPAFAEWGGVWRDEVRLAVTAMAREWGWRAATEDGRPPSFADYLDNAANLACTVVNVGHWIRTGDPTTHRRLPELVAASDAVQRVLRLVNDLATYQRDMSWGDLNAITVLGDPAEVRRRAEGLLTEARKILAGIGVELPRETAYLTRQVGYTSGFYGSTDFWGSR